MKRCPWVLAMVLAIARVAAAEGDPNALLREYSTRAALLEWELRTAKDPAERQRLMDELERVRHQMGPFDSAGTRVHPKAMWHDSAIQSLAEEIKRLEEKSASVFGPARDARLATRRLASACLVLGWRLMDEGPAKYQADAFGQYLANNLKTLDDLFDALGRRSQEQAKLDAGSDQHGVFETNLAKAKEGIAKMGQAAETFGKLPSPPAPSTLRPWPARSLSTSKVYGLSGKPTRLWRKTRPAAKPKASRRPKRMPQNRGRRQVSPNRRP